MWPFTPTTSFLILIWFLSTFTQCLRPVATASANIRTSLIATQSLPPPVESEEPGFEVQVSEETDDDLDTEDQFARVALMQRKKWIEKLQKEANNRRDVIDASICRESDKDVTRSILEIATFAVKCPEKSWSQYIATQWQVWWDEINERIAFDTRDDADRFLEYALGRIGGDIPTSPQTKALENRLVREYDELKQNHEMTG